MRVLLTGAAGFVGKAATEVLRREHEVRLFDVVPIPSEPEMLVGDIADFRTATEALAGMDAVVNLAIITTPAVMTPPSFPCASTSRAQPISSRPRGGRGFGALCI
jgi:nucleoside-diphosphate-sugar epimerase